MARDPMRALVGARAAHKRAGEHALARAVGDERDAEAVVAAATARRDAAAAAVSAARAELAAAIAGGADAVAIARGDAFVARLRRSLIDTEADLARAAGMRASAAAATGARRDHLAGAIADHRVAERALDRKTTEARRKRERAED